MSFFTHLECSAPCGAAPYDPRVEQHLCTCGAPLLARYDLDRARAWRRESLADVSGVELTSNPAGLIHALQKLAANDKPFVKFNHATAAMCIDEQTTSLKHAGQPAAA